MTTVSISGSVYTHYRGSLSWDETIAGRTALKVDLYDAAGTADPRRYSFVEVHDDSSNLLWAGHIMETNRHRIGTSGAYKVTVDCIDLTGLADRRVEARGWTNTTAGTIVTEIVDDWLSEEGVTKGQIDTGPEVGDARLLYRPVGEFLDKLAEETNAVWRIDKNRQLQWYDLSKVDRSAPQDLTADMIERESIDIGRSATEYRNVQILSGVKATTDPRTEVMQGQDEDDGTNTGSRSYAVAFPVHAEPTVEVDRNGDGSYVTETVAIRGVEDGQAQWYWSKGESEVVRDDSTAEIGPDGRVKITYVGQFEALVKSSDSGEVDRIKALSDDGSSGEVMAATERTDVDTIDAGFEKAGQLLVRFGGGDDHRITFNTRTAGYGAGMVCQLTVPGFDGEVRLESVEAVERPSTGITYRITAVQGPIRGQWTQLWWRALRPEASFVAQVGENAIVSLLETFNVSTQWDANVTPNVLSCAILNPDVPMPFTLC